MGLGSFLHKDYCVYYTVQRVNKVGYLAKGYIILQNNPPSGYVPLKLDRAYPMAEKAKDRIIAFCKSLLKKT